MSPALQAFLIGAVALCVFRTWRLEVRMMQVERDLNLAAKLISDISSILKTEQGAASRAAVKIGPVIRIPFPDGGVTLPPGHGVEIEVSIPMEELFGLQAADNDDDDEQGGAH